MREDRESFPQSLGLSENILRKGGWSFTQIGRWEQPGMSFLGGAGGMFRLARDEAAWPGAMYCPLHILALGCCQVSLAYLVGRHEGGGRRLEQIGRASCRERV